MAVPLPPLRVDTPIPEHSPPINAFADLRSYFPFPPLHLRTEFAQLDLITPRLPYDYITAGPPLTMQHNLEDAAQPEPLPIICRGCHDKHTSEDNLLKLRCLCTYCTECIERQFSLAMKDESMYPPRCLHRNAISLSIAKKHLSSALTRLYKSKALELNTKNRTYCFRLGCNSFVAPHSIHNGEAWCQKCNGKTCAVCKEEAHFGKCVEDQGIMGVMSLGRAKKWQNCPDCKQIVEKIDGCNHMSCRCGGEFCYKCGHVLNDCMCAGEEDEDEDEEGDDLDDLDIPVHPPLVAYPAQHHRPRTPVFRESEDEIISDTLGLRTDVDFEETGEEGYMLRAGVRVQDFG